MHLNHNLANRRTLALLSALLIALTLTFSACKNDNSTTPTVPTIKEQIDGNPNFTLLKAALAKSGLDVTLNSAGNYTLLAPTDDAFRAFGFANATAIDLAPIELIRAVVQYHVLGTKVESSAIPVASNTPQQTQLLSAPVYFTRPVAVTTSTGSVTTVAVNGARILLGDVESSNGVIHAIDRILLPPLYGNIPNTIAQIPTIYALLAPTAGVSFKLLQQVVAKTSSVSSLTATGPLTLFAPTDNAFRAVGYDSTKIAATPAADLTKVLTYHVVNGRIYTPTLTNGASLTTASGAVTVGTSTTAVTVTGKSNGGTASNVIGPDVTTSNGVIHIIDRLLLP
ncbi:fasciclin domain-containing protein [Spirosoma sp.]|uniref:fasciclin domain-containing protein n=1 Tax=Spirosoma sp. TaxID=1899569 RepID=UPI003B3BB377